MDEGFKFSSTLSSGGDDATKVTLTIEGDTDLGLQQLRLVIDTHFGQAQDGELKRGRGRPAGSTKEVVAARAGNGTTTSIASRMTG